MRNMTFRLPIRRILSLAAVLGLGAGLAAQKTQNEPVTDSSAQASPIRPAPQAPVDDSAQQASPIRSGTAYGTSIAPHTPIEVRLGRSIDSGHLKNGDTVAAILTKAVALSSQRTLGAGTAAELTVVETLPAGRIYAAGEFSLQLERIGQVGVYTDTLTYRGEPGHKDLPDSAPEVGTDAGLAAGAELVFHVLPPPEPASGEPNGAKEAPGSVNGVASGAPPPPGSSTAGKGSGKPGSGQTNASQKSITPAANTAQPAQDLGKSSPAPNQPAAPSGTSSTQTTQPHP